jgi:hypothetical protein
MYVYTNFILFHIRIYKVMFLFFLFFFLSLSLSHSLTLTLYLNNILERFKGANIFYGPIKANSHINIMSLKSSHYLCKEGKEKKVCNVKSTLNWKCKLSTLTRNTKLKSNSVVFFSSFWNIERCIFPQKQFSNCEVMGKDEIFLFRMLRANAIDIIALQRTLWCVSFIMFFNVRI